MENSKFAALVAFLASERASYINGTTICGRRRLGEEPAVARNRQCAIMHERTNRSEQWIEFAPAFAYV